MPNPQPSQSEDDFVPETLLTIDPLAPERNLAEAFLLMLALWTAVRAFFFDPNPLSVDVLLGPVWAAIWAVTLFVGSVLSLTGMYWRGRSLTALSLQQIGYAAFAPASLARGVALVAVGRPDEAVLIFGFALISMGRLWQLERRIGRFYPACLKAWLVARLRRWRDG